MKSNPNLGVSLFAVHCGICHFEHGAGTLAIEHRVGRDHGLLTGRSDLVCDYVTRIVRTGFGSMPPQTRVDLQDAELAEIAAYLSHDTSERCTPGKSDHG